MQKLIVANWKMNPETLAQAMRLARLEDRYGVIIAPPYPFLSVIAPLLKRAKLAAQDVFWEPRGAYTGEVSPRQLKSLGVAYVILGHSERRALGETDKMINKKVKAALKAGLKVILCIGEPKRELGSGNYGLEKAKKFVKKQLEKDLAGMKNDKLKTKNLIIAYEPIWAIGTGKPDTPDAAAHIAEAIKHFMKKTFGSARISVLYGGSVNEKNAVLFLKQGTLDGALVGGASLQPEEFKRILHSISR